MNVEFPQRRWSFISFRSGSEKSWEWVEVEFDNTMRWVAADSCSFLVFPVRKFQQHFSSIIALSIAGVPASSSLTHNFPPAKVEKSTWKANKTELLRALFCSRFSSMEMEKNWRKLFTIDINFDLREGKLVFVPSAINRKFGRFWRREREMGMATCRLFRLFLSCFNKVIRWYEKLPFSRKKVDADGATSNICAHVVQIEIYGR